MTIHWTSLMLLVIIGSIGAVFRAIAGANAPASSASSVGSAGSGSVSADTCTAGQIEEYVGWYVLFVIISCWMTTVALVALMLHCNIKYRQMTAAVQAIQKNNDEASTLKQLIT